MNNTKRFYDHRNFFFNGQCSSCHNFGYKASQCVAYKNIMTREVRKQRSMTRIKKSSYNKFYPLKDEIECSFFNNIGHKESECKSKRHPTPRYGKRRNYSKKEVA